MRKRKIGKWGGSNVILLSKVDMDDMGLKTGDFVDISEITKIGEKDGN